MRNARMLHRIGVAVYVAACLVSCHAPEPPIQRPHAEVEVQVPPPEQPEEQVSNEHEASTGQPGGSEPVAPPPEGNPSPQAPAQGRSEEVGGPAQERAAGWVSLFNGANLVGWQNAREPEAENRWLVEDGALTNEEHANDIATVEAWRDFELVLEYRIVEGGNSGVYLRGRVEIQILDSFGKTELEPSDCGGIYGQFAPLVNASKPAGDWNTLEARYVGDRLTAKLNGQVVLEAAQITEVTGGALPGDVDEPGPIMLQGDHGKIWFRDVKIRPVEMGEGAEAAGSDRSDPSDESEKSESPATE